MAEKRPHSSDRQFKVFAFLCWLQSLVSDSNLGHFPRDGGWSESCPGALDEGGLRKPPTPGSAVGGTW